ncbi:MAG TPA: SDR family oxidoreductase [Candidatus Brachybacterium merdavium]|uniref:SDR family oxidoreductase n=1 Tax=Candidatus Brachybacterium merdavium TaxID=2838513 RepID=A0A9D2LCT2_9MICO|nr:SDR family oxidoreductase [Candidatus Brachybacterium merdavium]
MALTATSTIGSWLDDPRGAPIMEELLTGVELPDGALEQVKALPLQQLVALSQGKLPQSAVDDMVRAVNDGTIPEESPAAPADARFAGRTVVVTGSAAGIGAAVATRVAREGGRVIAVDLAEERLEAFASAQPDADITPVSADIVEQDGIDRIVAAAGDRIDGLANVAGINDDFSPLHETSDAMWDRVIGVNLTGAFKLSRALIPVMLETGNASIVNVASEAGLRGNASGNAYTVSKHGVVGLTRSAAFMYGPQGIRVNAVAPGGVATGIAFPPNVSEAGAARLKPFQAQIPTIATAEQIAASITFLLSDDGVNINGVILPSDGGWSIQ